MGFESTIPASERLQTHALDHEVTVIGKAILRQKKILGGEGGAFASSFLPPT